MNELKNNLGQAVGQPIADWHAAIRPTDEPMIGGWCRLVPFNASHVDDLYAAFIKDSSGHNWTYLPYGPFDNKQAFQAWTEQSCCSQDPKFFTVIDLANNKAVGIASYLRIEPNIGVIEVGHIHFSPLLQGTTLATEAMYLMMKRVFETGYRRYEWKCDNLNTPSKNAALRLGFSSEGVFRQATMYKSRNRDTAWFSLLDCEWPANRNAFEAWLAADNFDVNGQQIKSLSQCRA